MFTSRRSIAVALVLVVAVAALSGCDPAGPDPDATETSDPTASSTPTPTDAEATPTPDPVPTTIPVTCETIVPQSRLDWIAAQGWTLFDPAEFFAKIRSEGNPSPLLRFQDNGGIVCPWTSGSHVAYVYGYSPLPADQVESARAEVLASDPYAESSFAGGPLFTVQMDENPFRLIWIDNIGHWYVASDEAVLDELRRIPH